MSAGGTSSGGASGAGMGGASSGSGGQSGGSAGSTGECVTGQTAGDEVVVIGDSFIELSNITQTIESHAKDAGSLEQNDGYIDNSTSGSTLSGGIPGQYEQAANANTIRFVLMNGGGNDCIADNGDAALAAAEDLFASMGEKDVEKVLYFFYPDPVGSQWQSPLKACLDTIRPTMKAMCDGLTKPKCYWLDQREFWDGHPEYTGDGIHPTDAGGTASGDAIWEAMVEHCIAQ
jgi:hypothetical protein